MNEIHNVIELKIETIIIFVMKSTFDFKNENINPEDIKILMPLHIKDALQAYNRRQLAYIFSDVSPVNAIDNVEILPHYKNEIVVFFKHNLLYKNKFEPKIFEL